VPFSSRSPRAKNSKTEAKPWCSPWTGAVPCSKVKSSIASPDCSGNAHLERPSDAAAGNYHQGRGRRAMPEIRTPGLIGNGIIDGPMCTNLLREECYTIMGKLLARKVVPS
jgi:hypothetical protein